MAALGGAPAGACWGAAMLTTTRSFPFGMATAAASAAVLILGKPFDRKALTIACASAAAVTLDGLTAWASHLDITPLDWVRRTLESAAGNDSVALGIGKQWSGSPTNVLTTALAAPAMIAVLLRSNREPIGQRRFCSPSRS